MSLTFIPQSSTCKGVIVSMISMKPLTSSIHSQHTKSCFLSRNAYNFKRHEADNPSQKTSEDFQSMKISFRVNTGKARSESKNNQSLPEERSMHGNTLNGSKNRVTMSNQNFGGENSVAKRGLGSIFHRVNPGKKEDERMSQRSISDVSTRLFMLSAAMAMILTLPVQLNAASNHILVCYINLSINILSLILRHNPHELKTPATSSHFKPFLSVCQSFCTWLIRRIMDARFPEHRFQSAHCFFINT